VGSDVNVICRGDLPWLCCEDPCPSLRSCRGKKSIPPKQILCMQKSRKQIAQEIKIREEACYSWSWHGWIFLGEFLIISTVKLKFPNPGEMKEELEGKEEIQNRDCARTRYILRLWSSHPATVPATLLESTWLYRYHTITLEKEWKKLIRRHSDFNAMAIGSL